MTDEVFNKKLDDLIKIFRLLKDKKDRKLYRAIIRKELIELTQV